MSVFPTSPQFNPAYPELAKLADQETMGMLSGPISGIGGYIDRNLTSLDNPNSLRRILGLGGRQARTPEDVRRRGGQGPRDITPPAGGTRYAMGTAGTDDTTARYATELLKMYEMSGLDVKYVPSRKLQEISGSNERVLGYENGRGRLSTIYLNRDVSPMEELQAAAHEYAAIRDFEETGEQHESAHPRIFRKEQELVRYYLDLAAARAN